MKYKCPVCGGELVKGFSLVQPSATAHSISLAPLKRTIFNLFLFRVRARVCKACGHIDIYVHPDDLSKLNS